MPAPVGKVSRLLSMPFMELAPGLFGGLQDVPVRGKANLSAADADLHFIFRLIPLHEELNFSVELPSLLKDCMYTEETETTAYDSTINLVKIYYEGEESDSNLFTFEEMDEATWESIQAEGGPVGTALGTSSSGRVVVLNTMQSNPFEEGTADFDMADSIFEELSVIYDSFTFLDE